ncbi:MAG: hypothetical protein CMN73_14685 [Sphingomonas sp.]|nr:hypothetical protein [Sphingomonas sp.]|tara:strand:+ start:418 stop:618 length:201 start_codon:yes stop_codon:yes gene_type:complete
MFDAAGIVSIDCSQTVGDLIFMVEGGLLRRRVVWPAAGRLWSPHRCLPAVARLGLHLDASLRQIEG